MPLRGEPRVAVAEAEAEVAAEHGAAFDAAAAQLAPEDVNGDPHDIGGSQRALINFAKLSVSAAGFRATTTKGALDGRPTHSGTLQRSFKPNDYVLHPSNPSMRPSAEPGAYHCTKVMILVPEVRDVSISVGFTRHSPRTITPNYLGADRIVSSYRRSHTTT